MKIGVLSDTHANSLEDLSRKIVDELSGTDLIIHAGDYVSERMVDELNELGNFKGVYGNMDPFEVREKLPSSDLIDIGGKKIGVAHPSDGGPPLIIEEKIKNNFNEVDAIIYGHSHKIKNEFRNGVLFFNPGSATGQFTDCKSFGLLTIGNKLEGKIITI
jgi:putative phosphoesterase